MELINRNRENIEESWLGPVEPERAYRFVREKGGLENTSETTVSRKRFAGYGFAYTISGNYNRKGKLVYMEPVFGEFGYVAGRDGKCKDNIEKLINAPEQVYLDWIALVAEANGERKINGKTYLEELKEVMLSEIENAKAKAIDKANKDKEVALTIISSLETKMEQDEEAELPV